MIESLVLGLFAALLVVCIALGVPLTLTLFAGFVLFFSFGLLTHHKASDLLFACGRAIKTVQGILILFVLVGALTAAWRASGTIPAIMSFSTLIVSPASFVLVAFLLNCAMSMLIGTAFGTAATMGVICMSMASIAGVNPMYVGGAVLAGAYFGDRTSPLSSSAMLVATITKTSVFDNVHRMLKTALVPFVASCLIYDFLSLHSMSAPVLSTHTALVQNLSAAFNLSFPVVIPALLVIVLAILKVNVKVTMLLSLILASILAVLLQKVSIFALPKILFFGYTSSSPAISHLVNGGGIAAMFSIMAIIVISSSYAGIFEETQLLEKLKAYLLRVSDKTSPFLSVLLTSVVASAVACNQSLAIMMCHQICDGSESNEELALDLENTVVTMSALAPWSVAAAATLAIMGAPLSSLLTAVFLYLLPMWSLVAHLWSQAGHRNLGVLAREQTRALRLARITRKQA